MLSQFVIFFLSVGSMAHFSHRSRSSWKGNAGDDFQNAALACLPVVHFFYDYIWLCSFFSLRAISSSFFFYFGAQFVTNGLPPDPRRRETVCLLRGQHHLMWRLFLVLLVLVLVCFRLVFVFFVCLVFDFLDFIFKFNRVFFLYFHITFL